MKNWLVTDASEKKGQQAIQPKTYTRAVVDVPTKVIACLSEED